MVFSPARMFKVNLCLRVAVFVAQVASGNYHHLVRKDSKKTDRQTDLCSTCGSVDVEAAVAD